MQIISDLHLHSKYARACSKLLDIPHLANNARIKGLNLLGTGDMQHPEWLKELKQDLEEQGNGLYKDKTGMNFMLTTELSLVYTQEKGRRVHLIMWAPSIEIVEQVQEQLKKWGRIDYDGRPIFNKNCADFTQEMKSISPDIEIIPAHAWTPWFAVLGEKGGFDSLQEAFQDQVKNIHAIETGLSSDPLMNWRIKELDRFNLVSFSDAHSPWPYRLGREATVFDTAMSYKDIVRAVRTGEGLTKTFEYFPEEGKYHYDGHRKCKVVMSPKEAIKHGNKCPKCGEKLTIGVAHRIEELADYEEGRKPGNANPFVYLIPLQEIIAAAYGRGVQTEQVKKTYKKLIESFGDEYTVLLGAEEKDLQQAVHHKIAKAIIAVREQKVQWQPGYDGEYGKPKMDDYKIQKKTLNDF